jgi:hypothetical protein
MLLQFLFTVKEKRRPFFQVGVSAETYREHNSKVAQN